MSVPVLVFFGFLTVAVVLWRSGVLYRWQQGREAKSEAGGAEEAEERSRRREVQRRENRRRLEAEERTNRILMRSIPSAESKRTMVGRTEIHTLEVAGTGAGLPIVLIHSFAGRKEEWGPLIESLASSGHRVLAPDLPGCGGSPAAEDGDHDIPAQTRRIRALAEAKGLLPCHLVGAGSGGTIAMLWAARNPKSIASLALIEPFGFRVPWQTPLDRMLVSGENPLLPREDVGVPARRDLLYAGEPSFDSESESLHMKDLIRNRAHHVEIWERSRADDRAGLLDVLASEVRTPLLYLQGGESQVVHPKTAQLVESLFGNRAEVHVIPGCGHLPAVERPRETLSLLLPFWQQVATSG